MRVEGHQNGPKRSTTTDTHRPICTATSKGKGQKERIEQEGENLITHSKFDGINQIQIENLQKRPRVKKAKIKPMKGERENKGQTEAMWWWKLRLGVKTKWPSCQLNCSANML